MKNLYFLLILAAGLNFDISAQGLPELLQTKLNEIRQNGNTFGMSASVIIDGEEITNNFELSQNYPNPFNPVTGIKYRVSSPPRLAGGKTGGGREGFIKSARSAGTRGNYLG